MSKAKIDYLKIRKMFEKTENKDSLDRLILHYLQNEYFEERQTVDPIIDGVELQEKTIEALECDDAMNLYRNNCEPQEKLLKRILDFPLTSSDALYLFRRGVLDIETAQKAILLDPLLEDFRTILLDSEQQEFEGFDFEALEKRFITISSGDEWSNLHTRIALQFLTRLPYNDMHLELARTVIKNLKIKLHSSKDNNSKEYEELLAIIVGFTKKNVTKNLTAEELIELLNLRKDYRLILFYIPKDTLKEILYIDKNHNYNTILEELFNSICAGTIDRIGFALDFFQELNSMRLNIVNAWTEYDKTLEMDVYGISLIENSAIVLSSLDEQYIEAKKGFQGPDKTHINKPLEGSAN